MWYFYLILDLIKLTEFFNQVNFPVLISIIKTSCRFYILTGARSVLNFDLVENCQEYQGYCQALFYPSSHRNIVSALNFVVFRARKTWSLLLSRSIVIIYQFWCFLNICLKHIFAIPVVKSLDSSSTKYFIACVAVADLLVVYTSSLVHTAKIAQAVQGCWKQRWTMFCCSHCSMLSTILFSIIIPDRRLIQAQQCWTILLTTLNNVGSKTLFNAVFNSPGQVVRFWLCIQWGIKAINSGVFALAIFRHFSPFPSRWLQRP